MQYVVCTNCTFLRAYSLRAVDRGAPPRECPACGHEVQVMGGQERFPTAYMSKVSRDLMESPELGREQRAG